MTKDQIAEKLIEKLDRLKRHVYVPMDGITINAEITVWRLSRRRVDIWLTLQKNRVVVWTNWIWLPACRTRKLRLARQAVTAAHDFQRDMVLHALTGGWE